MLGIRPNCECCNKDLLSDSSEAMICTFDCTFCQDCADEMLNGTCPNCGGHLESRPVRPLISLHRYPAATKRILKEAGCVTVT